MWLWNEFSAKAESEKHDLGIDLVAETERKEFWAIQCKFYSEDEVIDMAKVDSFISQATRTFTHPDTKENINFSNMLWVSTTSKWTSQAEEKIKAFLLLVSISLICESLMLIGKTQ